MRILHICGATWGAPWLCEIAREQAARGHDVAVVVAGDEGPLPETLRRDGVRHVVLPHDPFVSGHPLAAWRAILRLSRLMVAERPDIIQSHLFPSNIAGRLAAWLADVPIRLSMNAGPYILESPVLGDLDVRTVRLDTRVIASCLFARDLYVQRGVARTRTALVYYGSNPATFDPAHASPDAARQSLGVAPDTPLVGLVAYFYPRSPDSPTTPPHVVGRGVKGQDVLVRAVPSVLARVPDATFVLVGDATAARGRAYRREVEELAQTLGVASSVIFTGHRHDVPDLLAAFDVAVQCPLSENVGGAIEALLMGAPTVVSNVGGLTDVVRHDDTGLVVPPDDSEALADAIATLLLDRARARRLGDRGRALVLDQFTVSRTADDLDALYAECASDPRLAGKPPHRSGYRWSRRVLRQVTTPLWALRLLPPLLRAATGHRVASTSALLLLLLRGALTRARDLVVALIVLGVTSPYFLWMRIRRPKQALFGEVVVSGRNGTPFTLRQFAVEPESPWLRRLPWLITLATSRHLALFGPPPAPYDPDAPVARTDPRVRRRPGVVSLGADRPVAAPAHPPRPSRVERPS